MGHLNGSSFINDICLTFSSRYRISGSSLLAAMDQSSLGSSANSIPQQLDNEEMDGLQIDVNKENNEEKISRLDERSMRGQPTVDIAEVLRRWTHALQRIHKQSLQLVCYFIPCIFSIKKKKRRQFNAAIADKYPNTSCYVL